ncbi:MAG TPA: phage portal protein [Parvularculaceae bacterium]|nr:phage portal protein [Parvularculaceae bacterium]
MRSDGDAETIREGARLMLRGLRRYAERQAVKLAARIARVDGRRRYEGAGGGRRWSDAPASGAPIADELAARGPMRIRARHAVQNSGLAAKIADELVSAMVGTGFGFQSIHPDQAIRTQIENRFWRWAKRAAFDGRATLTGVIAQAARGWVIDGEAFLMWKGGADGAQRLLLLDPEQIDPALTRDLGGGARIVAGIEFDTEGRRVAYHVLRDAPGQPFAGYREAVRVPASEIIHLFTPISPGQVRGVSWFAPALLKLFDYDKTADAMLMRAKVGACLTAFVTQAPDGVSQGMLGQVDNTDPKPTIELSPGAVIDLASDEDVKFPSLPEIGSEMMDFLKWNAREIAAGLGVPYETATGDLSGVNYSSIRAGLIEFRRRIDALRTQILFPVVLEPIWRRVLLADALAGKLPADAMLGDFEDAAAVEFIPPGWQWVDPMKDVQADRDAVAAGFKSRREVVAARGRDIDALDAEIAADRKRAKALGIDFGGSTPADAASAAGSSFAGGGRDPADDNPEADE